LQKHVPGAGIKANTGYLRTTCSSIDDTSMPGGSEAYMEALIYYGSVKMAAKAWEESARSIYSTKPSGCCACILHMINGFNPYYSPINFKY